MASLNAANLGMASFKKLCVRFSPDRAIMVRGRPGIGKSQSVYQVASDLRSDVYKDETACRQVSEDLKGEASFRKALKNFWRRNNDNAKYASYPRNQWHYDMGLPVVERRLSQLSEGDIVGIPFDGGFGTVFKPTEWLMFTTKWPTILFLDELNRALKQVEQATFQIADSKAFYGHLLHDETRVYTACNIGDDFDVTPMDPAAISRYAIIDLDPTVEDWLDWARDNCHMALVEFIRSTPRMLENQETFEPNKKVSDRRAWGNLDSELTFAGLYETPESPEFLAMCSSMVGFAAGNSFWNYCKNRDADISAKDILTNWEKAKKRLPKKDGEQGEKHTQKMVECAGKLSDHIQKTLLTDAQAKELGLFMKDCPPEPVMQLWQAVNKERKNLFKLAPHIEDLMVRLTTGQARNVAAQTAPAKAKK